MREWRIDQEQKEDNGFESVEGGSVGSEGVKEPEDGGELSGVGCHSKTLPPQPPNSNETPSQF